MKNVLTGYVYNKPINVPTKPAWLMQAVTQLSRQVQPGLEMNLKGDRPFALAPLICTARAINASRPGEEPSIHGKGAYVVEDDLSLLDRGFLGMTARRRKAFFHKKANLDDFDFDTELVYTFVFESHQLNLPAYCVDLGFTRYSLRRALGTMPMQMLAVMWDPSKFGSGEEPERPEMLPRLWEMEIFHEKAVGRLLSNEEDAESEMDGVNEYILTSSTDGSLPLSPRTGVDVVRAEQERVEKTERDTAATSAQPNKCSPVTSPRASMS
jgi:hypothetical protein